MKCALRAVEPEDVDLLYRWENDPENRMTSVNLAPLSRFQLWEYANNYDANPLSSKQLTMMVDVDEATVGYVELYDISPRDGRAMCGIYITPAQRKKGWGTLALRQLWAYIVQSAGMRMLAAEVAADNEASVRLFKAAGFKEIARLPHWFRHCGSAVDAILFQREEIGHHEG